MRLLKKKKKKAIIRKKKNAKRNFKKIEFFLIHFEYCYPDVLSDTFCFNFFWRGVICTTFIEKRVYLFSFVKPKTIRNSSFNPFNATFMATNLIGP